MSIEFTNHTGTKNLIGGVMVSMLTSNGVDHGCEPRLGHNKDYEIGICYVPTQNIYYYSTKHTAFKE